MAQQARTRTRATKARPANKPLAPRIPWGRLLADTLGFVLLALSLVLLLSSLRPEGAVAETLGQYMGDVFGWLAPAAALWPGAVGLIVVAQRIAPRPWPWRQLAAAVAGSLAVLGLAAMV